MKRARSAWLIPFVAVMAPGGALLAEEKAAKEPLSDVASPAAKEPRGRAPRSRLTTDPVLSRTAERLLDLAHPVEGALVLLDVKTGKLLVWAERRRAGAQGSVLTAAKVPAASVFKVVTSAALLETAGVTPNDRVCISGGLRRIEREHLEAARGSGASCAPFSQALGHSKNAVFAQLATARLARQDLIDVAERLGFNAAVPFDWPVPMGQLQVPYNDLEFARTAAGFRGSTLSPLGGAYLASVIAGGGLSHRVRLTEPEPEPEAADTDAIAEDVEPPTRVLSATTAWRLTRMMEVTTHSGTCRQVFHDETGKAYLPGVRVAAKTGTLRPESRDETTSWFIGFAPSREPEIVVSVMLENGPVWRRKAAEVGRDLLRAYFHGKGVAKVSDPLLEPPRPSSPSSSQRTARVAHQETAGNLPSP